MTKRFTCSVASGLFVAAIFGTVFNPTASAQIRINEIGYESVDFAGSAKWVELYNAGSSEQDVSSLWLCRWPDYQQLSSLTVLAGGLTIPAGGFLVVAYSGLEIADGELGLYSNNSGFGNPANIIDYMEYGSTPHIRSTTAATAQVWTTGGFVEPAAVNESLSYVGGGSGAAAWTSQGASAGSANPGSVDTESAPAFDLVLTVTSVFPNPVRDGQLTVQFRTSETSSVDLEVLDLLGRRRAMSSRFAVASANLATIDVPILDLPSGTYLYRISTSVDGKVVTRSGSFVAVRD